MTAKDESRSSSTPPIDANQPLVTPRAEELLRGVLTLGREVHLEMDEHALVRHFLDTLSDLFRQRQISVRVVDLRSADPAKAFVVGGTLRRGVERERIVIKPSSVEKTRLKTALAESARIRLDQRWDSPFEGVAAGFAVPLVAAGEFYGVLDVGYELGIDWSEADEALILPLANHLSVALRNARLHRETTLLRDYQARLIEQANALILGVGRDWRITVCNQALCQLTGFERSALIGRDLRDWMPLHERGRLSKLFLQAMAGGDPDSIDVELPTKTGERVRTVWSVAAVASQGELQAIVAIGHDQTKLRDLQSQVIHAEKLATLGQLAAGVVHELNNPLTSITVYAEYLEKKMSRPLASIDPADVAKLRQIGVSAKRIMSFAKDLVQYAKPGGHELESVVLNQVVRQSLSFCEHLFNKSDLIVNRSFGADLPNVLAVPGQLEQIVINLVTNAIHAVGNSGVIDVATFKEGNRVCFSVSDNGPGMSDEVEARVFEPFFTTKTDGEGTGLGLSIVRNIAEQHNGEILVDKASSGGARFTVRIPAEP